MYDNLFLTTVFAQLISKEYIHDMTKITGRREIFAWPDDYIEDSLIYNLKYLISPLPLKQRQGGDYRLPCALDT